MVKDNEGLSPTAKIFFQLLRDKAPELLEVATVESPSEKTPLIQEPGSIVIVIPARAGFPIDKLYIETRREDILVVLGELTHRHYSWYSEETVSKYMLNAIQFTKDILEGHILFARRKKLLSRKEYIDIVREKDLVKKKRILAVYSWKGAFDTMI